MIEIYKRFLLVIGLKAVQRLYFKRSSHSWVAFKLIEVFIFVTPLSYGYGFVFHFEELRFETIAVISLIWRTSFKMINAHFIHYLSFLVHQRCLEFGS